MPTLETIPEESRIETENPANTITITNARDDSNISVREMVKDLLGGRCWITHLDKDTYCRSLRRRLRREVASMDKVRAVRYYQFPQRPDTTCTLLTEDEDQTEVFMYRTNTRLSFRPYISENLRHSRYNSDKLSGYPSYDYGKDQGPDPKKGAGKVIELAQDIESPQNYQSFRPGSFLTTGIGARPSRSSLSSPKSHAHIRSVNSYSRIKHVNSLRDIFRGDNKDTAY